MPTEENYLAGDEASRKLFGFVAFAHAWTLGRQNRKESTRKRATPKLGSLSGPILCFNRLITGLCVIIGLKPGIEPDPGPEAGPGMRPQTWTHDEVIASGFGVRAANAGLEQSAQQDICHRAFDLHAFDFATARLYLTNFCTPPDVGPRRRARER